MGGKIMAGHRFVVSGDPARARETVYAALSGQGFSVRPNGDWAAVAERGSAGASIAFGALAGKKGRHVILNIAFQTAPEGFIVLLTQGTSGVSGGLIGMGQASAIYNEIYNSVGAAFQNAGVLVSGGAI